MKDDRLHKLLGILKDGKQRTFLYTDLTIYFKKFKFREFRLVAPGHHFVKGLLEKLKKDGIISDLADFSFTFGNQELDKIRSAHSLGEYKEGVRILGITVDVVKIAAVLFPVALLALGLVSQSNVDRVDSVKSLREDSIRLSMEKIRLLRAMDSLADLLVKADQATQAQIQIVEEMRRVSALRQRPVAPKDTTKTEEVPLVPSQQ